MTSFAYFTHPAVAGALALISSWLLSGCRFGNRVAPTIVDSTEGFYDTQPKSFEVETSLSETRFAGALELVPRIVTSVMSDPVALLYSRKSEAYGIFHFTGENAFPVDLSGQSDAIEVATSLSGTRPAFFLSEECSRDIALRLEGAVQKYESPRASALEGQVSLGRLSATISVTETLRESSPGACATTLQEIQACLADASACQAETDDDNTFLHDYWQAYFQPYLEAGALTLQDLADLQTFSYRVVYE